MRIISYILITTLLAACSVGPDYRALPIGSWLPQTWLTPTPPLSSPPDTSWWQAFHDPVLNQIIALSMIQNYDQKIALERVREARAARAAATAALLPNIEGNLGLRQGNTSNPNLATYAFDGSFDASWELDLFGGNRRAREAATATVGAREAALANTQVSVIAETARLYLDYRRLQEQLILTRTNLKGQQEVEEAAAAQQAEGVADLLDVSRAASQALTTAALVPAQKTELAATRNTLAALVGLTPDQFAPLLATSRGVPLITSTVALDLPANVIAGRPDVRAAERELAAATANQGVAISNWFPKLTLGGLLGFQTTKAFGNVDTWTQGGSLKLPLLDFGRINALVKQADARQRIAYLTYRQTILNALAEIETGLTAYTQAQQRLIILQKAAKAAGQAEKLVRIHYQEGLSSLVDVLIAQQRRLEAESELVTAKAAVGQRYTALYKSLGVFKLP